MGVREQFNTAVAFLRRRKTAYQLAFGNPAGQDVMIDLAVFCRANESCFHMDPRKHAVLEGRREVFLRITQHMNLSSEQLYTLYSGRHYQTNIEENDDG